MRYSLLFATALCIGAAVNINETHGTKVHEENEVIIQQQEQEKSFTTTIVKGKHSVTTYIDGDVPLNKKYHKAEDIPKKILKDFNQVFVFSKNHFMIHKTREYRRYYEKKDSPTWDVWVEYRGLVGDNYYGEPFAHSVLKVNEAGGSVSISKSNNFGITFNPYANMEFSRSVLFLTLSVTFSNSLSLIGGYEVGVEASCNVPPYSYGGIFAFDTRTRISMERREWQKKRRNYSPGEWYKADSAVRNFDNPIFVCSTNTDYITDIITRMEDIKPSSDYSEFVPDISEIV